ncbi:MAG: tail fiber protein [Candidatus Hydrogenedentes bacterium]|nr:tail fiber protein [Candidatus Hydrogenedentota bacterium]
MRAAFNIRDPNQSVRELCFFQPAFVPLTTPAVVGEELKVAHGLGRVPIGWAVVKGDRTVAGDSIPVGTVIDFAGAAAPSGYLACDGSAVSRTTYSDLFEAIGTTYGAGDGSTTFNLPDFRRRVAMGSGGTAVSGPANTVGATGGAETHTLSIAEMPAHTHDVYFNDNDADNGAGEDVITGTSADKYQTSSTGGGGAHNNVQPSLVVTKAVKYSPTQGSLSSTTEWTNEFIYFRFAVASAALTVGIF